MYTENELTFLPQKKKKNCIIHFINFRIDLYNLFWPVSGRLLRPLTVEVKKNVFLRFTFLHIFFFLFYRVTNYDLRLNFWGYTFYFLYQAKFKNFQYRKI